ncbi:hypothetical protein [Streptomyces mangrovi]|uniref:hypothetical protein n=1 Tax=Streptomyces mangrovi TaxID=1206892 RepID=UPI0036D267D9
MTVAMPSAGTGVVPSTGIRVVAPIGAGARTLASTVTIAAVMTVTLPMTATVTATLIILGTVAFAVTLASATTVTVIVAFTEAVPEAVPIAAAMTAPGLRAPLVTGAGTGPEGIPLLSGPLAGAWPRPGSLPLPLLLRRLSLTPALP